MKPTKPFNTYKWRWLSVAPTEGLLDAPVFLGVLRVMARHEGKSKENKEIFNELNEVARETKTSVTLARPKKSRNLLRNSGQYWTETGLMEKRSSIIKLTPLGRKVAEGLVTQAEFAAIILHHTILPNPLTDKPEEIEKWENANLKIWPFKLILETIGYLQVLQDAQSEFLTNKDLVRIVIPLAGDKVPAADIAKYILEHRQGKLDVSGWPDCIPQANDKRMAHELLLFLANFGLLRLEIVGDSVDNHKFYLDNLFDMGIFQDFEDISIFNTKRTEEVVTQIRHSGLPSIIDRQRRIVFALNRKGQSKFRRNVLQAFTGCCFLTSEQIPEILEASHIVPVKHGGTDANGNGLCLRVDIHRLFDSGNLRIRPDGTLYLSNTVQASSSYSSLPKQVSFPPFLDISNVAWRHKYL